MSEPWEVLVLRYKPDDKRICNCRQAYETHFDASTKMCMRGGQFVDYWACAYGCGAAQIDARDHVAKCVIEDLK